MKTLDQMLLEADGSYRPFFLQLAENSGPVSPAYQFRTHVSMKTIEHDVLFSFKDERRFQAGIPQDVTQSERNLSKAEYKQVALFFFEANVFEMSVDRTTEKRDRVGISFNRLEIRLGQPDDPEGRHVCIDYLLSDLQEPAFAREKGLIDFVKSLR